jgi:hypothetical protein
MNTDKVSIKISAKEKPLLKTLEILEEVFPLSVRSKIMQNDDMETLRVWLTVAVEADPRQEILASPAARNPKHNTVIEAVNI